MAIAGLVLGGFRIWVAFVRRRRSPHDAERTARLLAGPQWRCSWQWPLVGAGAAALMFLAWLALDPVLQRLSSVAPGTMNALPDRSTASVLAAGISWLCAAVMEELIYRGGLQSWLGRRIPAWIAVVLVNTVFTLVHSSGPGGYTEVQLVWVFATGLLYARLFEVTGSVVPCIAAHACWNALSLAMAAGLPPAILPVAVAALAVAGAWRFAPRLFALRPTAESTPEPVF